MVNKEKMGRALDNLAKRIGFRVAPGFNERVIFRELFPRGLRHAFDLLLGRRLVRAGSGLDRLLDLLAVLPGRLG
jgi:hypothetical protein